MTVSGYVQNVSKPEMEDTQTDKNRYHEDLISFSFLYFRKESRF